MKSNKKKSLTAQIAELKSSVPLNVAQEAECTLVEEIRERQKQLKPELFSDKKVTVK